MTELQRARWFSVRIGILLVATFGCAMLAGLLALYTHGKALPRSDLAHGMSLGETLHDPFVRGVWLLLALVGGGLAFLFALATLWATDLRKSIPTVAAVTLWIAIITGPLGALGVLTTFASGAAAMVWCRKRFPVRATKHRRKRAGPTSA